MYSMGAVDARFNTTDAELVSSAEAAATIWNKAEGKTLLAYDPKATLKINLVYDERAASAKLGDDIARRQAMLETERFGIDQSDASQVASYNASVSALNAEVFEYNQTAGHPFREGEYVRDDSGERITIFEFVGTGQLERVLAHEFGHALGLGHNTDPKAIMYAKNESGSLTPRFADLLALRALCGS